MASLTENKIFFFVYKASVLRPVEPHGRLLEGGAEEARHRAPLLRGRQTLANTWIALDELGNENWESLTRGMASLDMENYRVFIRYCVFP